MSEIKEKNPFEDIRIGDEVVAERLGANISPVRGKVVGTNLNGQECLVIDTGERVDQYVPNVERGCASRVEVPVLAYVFGDGGKVVVSNVK